MGARRALSPRKAAERTRETILRADLPRIRGNRGRDTRVLAAGRPIPPCASPSRRYRSPGSQIVDRGSLTLLNWDVDHAGSRRGKDTDKLSVASADTSISAIGSLFSRVGSY